MKFSGDLDKNLKLMEKFFTEKYKFVPMDRPFFVENKGIEKELYLINYDFQLKIIVVKYDYDDEEVDITVNGPSENIELLAGYVWIFLDPENIGPKGQNKLKEIKDFFKKDIFSE